MKPTHQVSDVGLSPADDVSDQFLHGADARDNVAVRDLNSLGCSRRPRSVHDARDVVRLGQVPLGGVLLSQLDKLVERVDLELAIVTSPTDGLELVESPRGDVFGSTVVDDQFDGRGVGEDGAERAEEGGLGKDAVRFRFVDRVAEAFLAQRVVRGRERDRLLSAGCIYTSHVYWKGGSGHQLIALREGRRFAGARRLTVGHDLPVPPRRSVDVEDGARVNSAVAEGARGVLDVARKLAVGPPLVVREVKVRPLFHLFHLLAADFLFCCVR